MFSLSSPYVSRGLAFALGAMGVLGLAPFFYVPFLLISLAGIWFLLTHLLGSFKSNTSLKTRSFQAGLLGWFFGWGYFVAGLYWLSNALMIDIQTFWWLLPASFLLLPGILALFIALPFSLSPLIFSSSLPSFLTFSALWVIMEWVRGHVFTGFPWNLVGYTWGGINEMAQLASLGGVYLLSFLTLLLAFSWEWIWRPSLKGKFLCVGILSLTLLAWGWGKERLTHPHLTPSPLFAVRLVQPNISQTLKWAPENREKNFKKLIRLTIQPSTLPLKAIVWPESALSFFIAHAPFHRLLIGEALPPEGLLFTGGLRCTPGGDPNFQVWNSLLVLDTKGEIIAHCDKFHLVPFGEYLPWRKIIDSLFGNNTFRKITAGTVDFTPGLGPQNIALPQGFPSFSGLVCYEVIFPRAIINPSQPRPGWIINVTNDAWYGDTTGPYQHLETAHFRAIEEGIPLIRVANSGISALFDAYGRQVGSLPLNTEGFLDVMLPSATLTPPFYGQWGDGILFSFLLILLSWNFIGFWRNKKAT